MLSKDEVLVQRANRPLNAKEKKFLKNKITQFQDYLKSVKGQKFGFSKRELSKINVDDIQTKCIEFSFDESLYADWFQKIKEWDEWQSQNMLKKAPTMGEKTVEEIGEPELVQSSKDGQWNMDKTKGEKHMKRIKMLNAHKRNEAFDELYEESREARCEQLSMANFKRQIIMEARQGIIDLNSEEIQEQLRALEKEQVIPMMDKSEKLAIQ